SIALPAARSLERVYASDGRNPELAEILRIEVRLEDNADARRQLFGRLGELCERVLGDLAGAIAAWKSRLDDDPADRVALSALDRLYERTQDWRSLVDILRARERQAQDRDARKELVTRIATTLADRVGDVEDAVLAYRTIVDDFGAERPALAALSGLYEKA